MMGRADRCRCAPRSTLPGRDVARARRHGRGLALQRSRAGPRGRDQGCSGGFPRRSWGRAPLPRRDRRHGAPQSPRHRPGLRSDPRSERAGAPGDGLPRRALARLVQAGGPHLVAHRRGAEAAPRSAGVRPRARRASPRHQARERAPRAPRLARARDAARLRDLADPPAGPRDRALVRSRRGHRHRGVHVAGAVLGDLRAARPLERSLLRRRAGVRALHGPAPLPGALAADGDGPSPHRASAAPPLAGAGDSARAPPLLRSAARQRAA